MTEQHEELSAEIAGQKFNYKGLHLGNLLQLALIGVIIYGGWVFLEARFEQRVEHKTMTQVLEQQSKLLERQAVAQEEFNYIVTLSATDREKLNLRMPESLRTKLGAFR